MHFTHLNMMVWCSLYLTGAVYQYYRYNLKSYGGCSLKLKPQANSPIVGIDDWFVGHLSVYVFWHGSVFLLIAARKLGQSGFAGICKTLWTAYIMIIL